MQGTDQELLVVISNQGHNDEVMEAARAAGAKGGTVLRGVGTEVKEAERFLGVSLGTEKELSLIVVRTEIKNAVMSAIMEKCGIGTPAKSVAFSLPVSDVAGIMKQCDVAVSAGGTTLSELCAMGIPAISYLNADNQRKGIEEFARNEIIPYAGDVTDEKNKDAVIDNILKFINQFFNLPVSKQRDVSDKMRNYIDGQGACRIACELLK